MSRSSRRDPAPPDRVLRLLDRLRAALPAFDRVSVGFPGVVKRGRIVTAPNLGTRRMA